MWYCIVTNDPKFYVDFAELHIGSSNRYENLFENYFLNCYDRNLKICCHGFTLALFQSTAANKLDSEQYSKL